MNYNVEYCRPFENKNNIWMKLEHVGRYVFAKDFLKDKNIKNVGDIACGNGYGSNILSAIAKNVFAVDRKLAYFNKEYLSNRKLHLLKVDLNEIEEYDKLPQMDAVVCFETLEHLENPIMFLKKLYEKLVIGGWLLLSFPNSRFERFDEKGNNKDIFHLHVFDKNKLEKKFGEIGFEIVKVLGQGLCNEMCSLNSKLVKDKILKQKDVDKCFNYDEKSIVNLSKLFASVNDKDIEESYSYIYVLKK